MIESIEAPHNSTGLAPEVLGIHVLSTLDFGLAATFLQVSPPIPSNLALGSGKSRQACLGKLEGERDQTYYDVPLD